MSEPMASASKTVLQANESLKEAKKQISQYSAQAIKNNEVLKQAKEAVSEAKKQYSENNKEIKRAKNLIDEYSKSTGLSKNQIKENNKAKIIAQQTLSRLTKEQINNTEVLKQAQGNLEKYKKISEDNNKNLETARAKTREYSAAISAQNKHIAQGQKSINSFGQGAIKAIDGAIIKTIKLGAVLATTTLAIASKMGFSEAMDMEGYKAQLVTATKDTEKAGQLMASAVEFANKTPFETGEVVGATAKMEAYGISSTKWLADVADMAGATNKGIDQATEAMADAVMGEFERLKEFGIKKEELIANASKKYGDGVVFNKKGQVLDQIKLEEILQSTMQEKYKGGAESMANTAKGLWSTISGVTKSSLSNIIGMQNDGTVRQGSLYEMLKEQMQLVVNVLNKWQSDGTIQKISEIVMSSVKSIISIIKICYNFISDNSNIITAILIFIGTIYATVKAFALLKAIIFVVSVVMGILNGTLMMSPLAIVAIAIGAVVAVGYLLYSNWNYLVTKAKELWDWFTNLIKGTSDFALILMGPIAPILLLIKHFDKLKEVVGNAWGFVKGILGIEDKKVELGVEKTENSKETVDKKITQETSKTEGPNKNKEEFNVVANSKKIGNVKPQEISKENIPNQYKDKFNVTANSKKEINNIKSQETSINTESESNNKKDKATQNIVINLNGDFYGMNDFNEKIAEAVVKMLEQNKANVVG
ncbi:MAG: hypothetical protein ACRC0S_01640 [Fusobacteriaceae bacterium]